MSNKTDFDAFAEYAGYRGVIECVKIPRIWNVTSGDNGETSYVVGRQNASKIVKALSDAGYSIVRVDLDDEIERRMAAVYNDLAAELSKAKAEIARLRNALAVRIRNGT